MRLLSFGAAGLFLGTILLGACSSSDDGSSSGARDGGTSIDSTGDATTSTTPPVGTTPLPMTTTTESLTVNGAARVYVLSVPTTIDPTKVYPVVMDLHGSPDTAAGESGDRFSAATGTDAIIVYPQALGEDSGAFSWDLSSAAANNQDVAFLEALPAALTAKGLKIDPTKVFGFGYSGGAFFLQVYQCLGAKVFRAIAAMAGGSPDSLRDSLGANGDDAKCVKCPGTPVPELIIFGALDDSNGGDYQALCQAQASGCAQTLTATTPAPCQKYDGCPADKPVEYCNIPNLGHAAWSEANATSWSFFKTYL